MWLKMIYKKIVLDNCLENYLKQYSKIKYKDISLLKNLVENEWYLLEYCDHNILKDILWLTDPTGNVILINNKISSLWRLKFTIAHELWHAILFNNWINEINIEIEKKCDEFAWRLLVSENHLIEAWKYEKSKNKLAKKFWVSDVCLEIRLDKENITPSETFWLAPILHNR